MLWQNSTEEGSPPCSPQMPILRSGLVCAAELDSHFDELADAGLVESGKRVGLEDLLLIVGVQELAGVVTGEAEGHLGEVVCAEGEELGFLGDLVGCDAGARNLDHRADLVFEVGAGWP